MTSSASGPSGGRDAAGPRSAPSSPPPGHEPERRGIWTDPQRRVLIGFLSILIVILAVRRWHNPTHVSDPQPARPARADELADRIDPNAAPWEHFAALPGIGEVRAREIVAYRDSFVSSNPGRRAFERPEDLLRIRGIGVAMLEGMAPYLVFPGSDERNEPAP